jgi:hypothetical protein
MKPVLKNTQEKIFPETLGIPSMVTNFVVGGKSLLWTITKGFYHACKNDLKILTSYHHPMPKHPPIICKYKAQEIKSTYRIFRILCRSLFTLGHSLTTSLLSMLTCIHKRQEKNSTCISSMN